MSAFSKLKWYARKPVAVIMAASLVTSTVPVVNLMQAAPVYAAPASEDTGTLTSGSYSNGVITLIYDSDAGEAGSYTLNKDDVLAALNSQHQDALDGLLAYNSENPNQLTKQINEDLASLKKEGTSEDETFELVPGSVQASVAGIDDFDVSVADDSGVKLEKTNDGWTVSAEQDATNVPLTITITSITVKYKFQYTHTIPAEESPEGDTSDTGDEVTGDVDSSESTAQPQQETLWFPGGNDGDKTQSMEITEGLPNVEIPVSASDYWADAQGEVEKTPEVDGPSLTYGDDAKNQVVLNGRRGYTAEVNYVGDAADYISVSDVNRSGRDYSVNIKPLKASDKVVSFTVTFSTRKGKELGTIKVNVPAIQRKQIDLSTQETSPVDFRMADKQSDAFTDAANAVVAEQTNNEVTELFTGAQIKNPSDYYAAATGDQRLDATAVTLTVDDNAEGASNYTFTTSSNVTNADGTTSTVTTQTQPTIVVSAMQTMAWGDNDEAAKLSLSGTALNGTEKISKPDTDPNSGVWFRDNVTATYEGGKIADATELTTPTTSTSFKESLKFGNEAQGVQSTSFFTQDKDGVVRRVDGVAYLFDNVAPALTALDAQPGSRQYKSSDGQIWASEKMDVQFVTNEGAPEATKSGIESVSASYTQKGSSKNTEAKNIDYSTDNGVTTYSFSIDEDSEVSTDSIKVNLKDRAGNENNNLGINDTQTNIEVAKLVAQATAPTINVSWDSSDAQNGHYYNHNRSVTFTVNAPFFEYTQEYLGNHAMATITKDGAAWKTVTPGDFTKTGDDTWSCTISFTEDGDYEVSNVNATDVLGRTSTAEGDTFTIDKTAPTMQVTFDNNNVANGMYYNAARTATITITEHNFDPSLVNIAPTAAPGNGSEVGQPAISGWSTNGDVHTATVTFPGQGVYTLSVDGMDLATNALTPYTCPEFVVDTITPEITISDVENMTAYAGDVAPSVSVHDTNLDSATDIHVEVVGVSPYGEEANPFSTEPSFSATDASVSYRNPADDKANDNVYTVVVNAVDLAGNTSDDAVTFSVNRFGSTYVISDETGKMLNEYLKFDDTSDVRVTEINPSGLDTSQTAVELTRDTSNTTLTADDYTTQQGSASGWQEYTYTVGRDNYDSDGVYRVLFHSKDAAGNVSENEMEGKNAADQSASAQINFAVDDTAPLATFADLTNAEPYNESSHVAKVTFEDNLMLDHAVVEIDGKEVATFDADQLAQNATQEFTINESNGNQSVKVKVYDAAGNEGEASMDNVVVTTNPFELWRRNTPLFAATIAVAVLAVAGIIFAVAKKRSKDDDAEA